MAGLNILYLPSNEGRKGYQLFHRGLYIYILIRDIIYFQRDSTLPISLQRYNFVYCMSCMKKCSCLLYYTSNITSVYDKINHSLTSVYPVGGTTFASRLNACEIKAALIMPVFFIENCSVCTRKLSWNSEKVV